MRRSRRMERVASRPSISAWRSDPAFAVDEGGHSVADLVTDAAHFVDRFALGVGQWPVIPAETGHDGAEVTAAHRHEQAAVSCEFRGQALRFRIGKVRAQLVHHGDHLGMNALAGLGSCGGRPSLAVVGDGVEERSRHLRAARVVDAGEDDGLHGALSVVTAAAGCGTMMSGATCGSAGTSQRNSNVAAEAPSNWAMMKAGASPGRMPANVLLPVRASVTAGLANDVLAVNQYAATMYAATANGMAPARRFATPQIVANNPNEATNSLRNCAAPARM